MAVATLLVSLSVACQSRATELLVGDWQNDHEILDAKPGEVHLDVRADGTWSATIQNPELEWIMGERVDGNWQLGGEWVLTKESEAADRNFVKVVMMVGHTRLPEENVGGNAEKPTEVSMRVSAQKLVLDSWPTMSFERRPVADANGR